MQTAALPRYAIYYTPPAGPLADFGAAWLGWDCAHGCALPHPQIDGVPRQIADITETPRKYGLHGTLKPPFHLADGCDETGLITALEHVSAMLKPAILDRLELAQLGRFIALIPRGETTGLADIASALVEGLDGFRAPPSAAEIARRNPAHLNDAQRRHLERWGYPYVFDQFKFHITLTGKLPKAEATQTRKVLAPLLAPILPAPFEVREVTLLRSDPVGRFVQIARVPLGG